jgi:hypothetical protein
MEGDVQGIIESGVRQSKGAEANIGGARLPKDLAVLSELQALRR